MTLPEPKKGYHDLYFRVILALLAAHMIIAFGARESIFLLFTKWFYYRDMVFSFVISFLLISEVYGATVNLDKHFDWKDKTVERIGLQLLLGLLLPTFTAFVLAAVYFSIFGINILHTGYLKFDLPVIMILLAALNIYYFAFYCYKQWKKAELRMLEMSPAAIKPTKDGAPKGKAIYVVQKGAKNIPLPVETISYFFHDGDYNFLRTVHKEDFLINQPLDDVQQQLSDKLFFRVNRQMIVNFTACRHYEPLEYGKLKLIVSPDLKEPVVISQKRAKNFKEWIER